MEKKPPEENNPSETIILNASAGNHQGKEEPLSIQISQKLKTKLMKCSVEHTGLKNNVMLRCSTGKRQNRKPHLSEEVIFNILLRLPADIIYNVMRFVCRGWYDVIHDCYFINKHLHRSTEVLLTQNFSHPESAHFVEITRECDVRITKLGYQFHGIILASCDGLVLCRDPKHRYILHISNPVTKQHKILPPVSFSNIGYSCGIAHVESTGYYKVVYAYLDKERFHCAILTLGVDTAWRHFDMDFVIGYPISIGGFMHWRVEQRDYILGLDVENETFHHVPLPENCWFVLKMGMYLSFVTQFNGLSLNVWVLRKTRNWEWVRMPDIDITNQKRAYERILIPREYDHLDLLQWSRENFSAIHPCAWLYDREIMIFLVAGTTMYIVHNIKTGKVYPFVLDKSMSYRPRTCVHIHSLVFPSNLG